MGKLKDKKNGKKTFDNIYIDVFNAIEKKANAYLKKSFDAKNKNDWYSQKMYHDQYVSLKDILKDINLIFGQHIVGIKEI